MNSSDRENQSSRRRQAIEQLETDGLAGERDLLQRTSSRPEYIYHGFMFVFATTIIVMSFVMRSVGPMMVFMPGSSFPMPESCTARILFGVDCPGCGLTRAFISISHGNWLNAWAFNPASFAVYGFVIGQIPWRLFQIARMWRGVPAVHSIWLYLIPAVVYGCMFAQWLEKMLLR